MNERKKENIYDEFEIKFYNIVVGSLKNESDRAKLILIVSWIDYFLHAKIQNEFSKGNKKARKELFSANGPFTTFSSKLNLAFCAGWIDSDVFYDIQIIRKLRNDCAHSIENISLDEEKIRNKIEEFKVPKRKFHDWGELWAVSTDKEIILGTCKKPNNVTENLYIPGSFTLNLALPVILTVLISNLKLPFSMEGDNKDIVFAVDLPDYLKVSGGKP